MVSWPLKESAIRSSRTVKTWRLTPHPNSWSAPSWALVDVSCGRTHLTWRSLPAQLFLWSRRDFPVHVCCLQCFQIFGRVIWKHSSPWGERGPGHTQGPAWRLRFVRGEAVDRPFFPTDMHSVNFLNAVLFSRWSILLESFYESIPEIIGHIFVNITYSIIMYTISMPAYLSF